MTNASSVPLTLIDALWPADRAASASLRAALRSIALILFGSIALWLSAKIQVPLWPVPITMQTFVVLTLGIAYGWRLAGATLLLYLAQGAAGLPVFAGTWSEGGGIGHLVGPTAGYLIGFVVAAVLVGRLAEHGWDRSPMTAAAAMLIGNLVIYAFGLVWLGAQIGYGIAVEVGLLPFLFGDVLKIGLGAAVLPFAWTLIRRRRG